MSLLNTNDLSTWSNEQLHEHEDNDDKLFNKKNAEQQWCMKAWKEVEHQRMEEEARQKAEDEVEGQRKAKEEARACTEEVVWLQSLVAGPSKGKQPRALMSAVGPTDKKKAWTWSSVADNAEDKEWVEGEGDCDMLGVLMEVLMAIVAEMCNMAVDWRCVAVESHVQMERMLGTLEEIQGCLDLEELEVGLKEDYEEEEVAEAAAEREGWKAWSGEEEEKEEWEV
ncbi:hypothetical protein BS17DRAFT_813528 [Gyrodon lividus]|nr:hypothetical protein BS17DRAFT_813528 [Gyrodon lividus]